MNTDALIIQISNKISDLTRDKCAQCRVPYSCCARHWCNEARKHAVTEYGIDVSVLRTDHPRLPFMSNNGCVVSPYLRPICTIHICEEHLSNETFAEKYYRLRNVLGYLLWRKSRSNPNSSIVILSVK